MTWISHTHLLHCVFILKVVESLYFLKIQDSLDCLNLSYHHTAYSKSSQLWCAWPNSALCDLEVGSRLWNPFLLVQQGLTRKRLIKIDSKSKVKWFLTKGTKENFEHRWLYEEEWEKKTYLREAASSNDHDMHFGLISLIRPTNHIFSSCPVFILQNLAFTDPISL